MPNANPTRLPSADYLRACFTYDPITGSLHWRARPRDHFTSTRIWAAWNTRWDGTSAGGVGRRGYHYVRIKQTHYYRHRIVWKITTGEEPPDTVDHEDRNSTNDRSDNLRAATQPKQAWNTGRRKNNTSGCRGVSYRQDTGKWAMHIMVNGKRTTRSFQLREQAAAAYEEAARQAHGDFYRPPD